MYYSKKSLGKYINIYWHMAKQEWSSELATPNIIWIRKLKKKKKNLVLADEEQDNHCYQTCSCNVERRFHLTLCWSKLKARQRIIVPVPWTLLRWRWRWNVIWCLRGNIRRRRRRRTVNNSGRRRRAIYNSGRRKPWSWRVVTVWRRRRWRWWLWIRKGFRWLRCHRRRTSYSGYWRW